MNKTILSYIFIALSFIFIIWSFYEMDKAQKNKQKNMKIILLPFIDGILALITLIVFGNLFQQSTYSSAMTTSVAHIMGASIKNTALLMLVSIPILIICYPLLKKSVEVFKSSGLSIFDVLEIIFIVYVIYKIATKFLTF
jgi:hypothetical protein